MDDHIVYEDSPLAEYLHSLQGYEADQGRYAFVGKHGGETREATGDASSGPLRSRVLRVAGHVKKSVKSLCQRVLLTPSPNVDDVAERQRELSTRIHRMLYSSHLLEDELPAFFANAGGQAQRYSNMVPENEDHAGRRLKHWHSLKRIGTDLGAMIVPAAAVFAWCYGEYFEMLALFAFAGAAWNFRLSEVPQARECNSAHHGGSSAGTSDKTVLNSCRILHQTEALVRTASATDAQINRGIKTIRELELVARSYRLPRGTCSRSMPVNPVPRIELRSPSKRCRTLRTYIRAALILGLENFNRSCIGPTIPSPWFVPEDTTVEPPSTEELRLLFKEYHAARRRSMEDALESHALFIGRLVARQGEKNAGSWVHLLAEEHEQQICALFRQMCNVMSGVGEILKLDCKDPLFPGGFNTITGKSQHEQRSHEAALDNFPSTRQNLVRGLPALDHLLRAAQVALRVIADDVSAARDLKDHEAVLGRYRNLGPELKDLVRLWEAGLEPATRSETDSHSNKEAPAWAIATEALPRSTVPWPEPGEDESEVAEALKATGDVFEGVAVDGAQLKLSRAERIAQQKQKREAEAAARQNSVKLRSEEDRLMDELRSVIMRREMANPRFVTSGEETEASSQQAETRDYDKDSLRGI